MALTIVMAAQAATYDNSQSGRIRPKHSCSISMGKPLRMSWAAACAAMTKTSVSIAKVSA
jgi:hypothetical protein